MSDGELRSLLETSASRSLGKREPPDDRPWVALNMASSADGRATVGGKSGGLGNEADHRQFAGLRREVDCVLVGTGTLATERYGPIVRDPAARAERIRAGRRAQPLCCTATRSGRLPLDIPLFADAEQEVVVYSAGPVDLDGVRARVDVRPLGAARFADALRDLRRNYGTRLVLCEGGPRMVSALLAEGLLDELFLTFSPLLVAGNGVKHLMEGPEARPPVPLELVRLLESDGFLFLRYLVAR